MIACRPDPSTASDHPTNTPDSHLPAQTQHSTPSYSGPTPKPDSSSSSGTKDYHSAPNISGGTSTSSTSPTKDYHSPPNNSGGTSTSSTPPTKEYHSPPDSSASKDSSSTAPSLDSSSKDSSGTSPGHPFSGSDFSHGSKSSNSASGPSGPVDISTNVDVSKGDSSSGMFLNPSRLAPIDHALNSCTSDESWRLTREGESSNSSTLIPQSWHCCSRSSTECAGACQHFSEVLIC